MRQKFHQRKMEGYLRLNKRISRELHYLKSTNLSRHYNLMNNLQIHMEPVGHRQINLNMIYHKPKDKIEILDLPEDMNRYIQGFLSNQKIQFCFELYIYPTYPFEPIRWSLNRSLFEGFSDEEEENILTFVNYKLKLHDRRYVDGINWSVAMTLEKDILNFYTMIHEVFDSVEKKYRFVYS